MWEVEYTHEFGDWYATSPEKDQDAMIARIELLEQLGPALGRPAVDNVHQSRHPNMKELRSQGGVRILFAFDPRRMAILLIGGNKSPADPLTPSWNQWYQEFVAVADDLYDTHLHELHEEGLL